jgi:hypothetical protein
MIAHAGESFVPLQKGVRIASDDLLYGGNLLTSREAQDLSDYKSIDLSLLNPKSNEIWSAINTPLNDQEAIELQENETLTFEGGLSSNTGLYRFNAIPKEGNKIYSVHLDKTLHTLLLRKNILRKLGYRIPAIKYLKKITIEFKTLEEREQFLKRDIPENTLGAAERWVKNINDLTLDLYDVAVTEPSENDFYNVAMGIPTLAMNSRTLRSLVIPYTLLDLYESINKFSWISGKVDNRAVVLAHFTGNEFGTTLEDALWMIRKLNKLSREDLKKAVDESFFPQEIGQVVLEKIISRRNSLNRLFSVNTEDLTFNSNITIGESVKKGKVIEKDYPGYASRFSYGDAESPFDQIGYYLFSKIQSSVIDNLIEKFNSYLVGFDLGKARSDFFQKQFTDGLNHFLQTGELRPIGIDTWASPLMNFNLIFSRDIILGNYLGTDNLVQMADTFGASMELGAHLGIEGLGNNLAASANVKTSVVRTFSHLKPVKSLKQSLKEPYRNMFVNLLKRSLKDRFMTLSELKDSSASNEEKSKKAQILLKEISQYLDTGESLVMTDRFMPSTSVKLNFNLGLVGAGVGVGAGVTTIKRIHLFKKSPKILQIYDDSGFVSDINVSFQVSNYIPILAVSGKIEKGNYNLKSYQINLSSDLDENPDLYRYSYAVYALLRYKEFQALKNLSAPVKLNAKFKDRNLGFSFLFWQMKALKARTYYDIEAKDGINGQYFSLNKDFSNGVNLKAFATQVANYYLSPLTNGNIQLSSDDNNPGESFLGRSKTQSIRFEASINSSNMFERKFLSVSDLKQGWSVSAKKLKKMMVKVNEKFQTNLFEISQIDFEKLRMFKVGYHINIYEKGIERLNKIRPSKIDEIESRYRKKAGCEEGDQDYESPDCGDLSDLRWDISKCKKAKKEEDLAACNIDLVEDLLDYLDFSDFKNLIGVENLYVYGTIDGYRKHSEILNDTIFSNTIGKIGSKDWNGPLETVRELLGLSGGEFSGGWLREQI